MCSLALRESLQQRSNLKQQYLNNSAKVSLRGAGGQDESQRKLFNNQVLRASYTYPLEKLLREVLLWYVGVSQDRERAFSYERAQGPEEHLLRAFFRASAGAVFSFFFIESSADVEKLSCG